LAARAADQPGVTPCVADIADDHAVAAIAAAIAGPVRLALNCAGIPVAGGVAEAPTAAVEAAVAIKITGMLRLVRAVESRLLSGARRVAIGGHYGFEPVSYHVTAGTANAALPNLMRLLSLAYGERGITLHVLASSRQIPTGCTALPRRAPRVAACRSTPCSRKCVRIRHSVPSRPRSRSPGPSSRGWRRKPLP
jgi:NAD(P)-dependent dehydrogenase (short-subunit alcohol dehydrogenase family)